MNWREILELLKTLSDQQLDQKAMMLMNDEYWLVDLANSAKSGEVYIIPGRDSGEE